MNFYSDLSNFNNSDFSYIISVDESGSPSYSDLNCDFFILSGCIIHYKDWEYNKQQVISLKNKYWENGMYKGKRVVFHARDITRENGPFSSKIINTDDFKNDLIKLIEEFKMTIISIAINKNKLKNSYTTPWDVYQYSIELLLERFSYTLNNKNKGILLIESRSPGNDIFIKQKIRRLFYEGGLYVDSANFKNMTNTVFCTKRIENDSQSFWSIEITDLVSRSVFEYIKSDKENFLFQAIERKFRNFPNYIGRGLKVIE